MSKIKNGVNGIVCAYCGKEKKEVMFVIGASNKPDWCMVAGTGKMNIDTLKKELDETLEAFRRFADVETIEEVKQIVKNYSRIL